MQTIFRYFTDFKITTLVILSVIFNYSELCPLFKRNPFCFSDKKVILPFSFRAVATVHNGSKSFAILSSNDRSKSDQKIIASKGDVVLGYKLVDILDDMLILHDDQNNEITLPLKQIPST